MKQETSWKPPTKDEVASIEAEIVNDKTKYETMKQGFANLKQKLEEGFEANLEAILDEKTKEVLDEATPQEQWKMLKAKYTELVETKIEEAREQMEAFEEALFNKQLVLENRKLDLALSEENPELDMEAMVAWLHKDLTPRQLEDLLTAAKGDKKQFIALAIEKFKSSQEQKQEEEGNKMPTDLSGVAGATGDVDNNDGDDTDTQNEFLANSGLFR